MTADAKRIGIATGATAGLNALLFLWAAWAIAVTRGLKSGERFHDPVVAAARAESIAIVLTPPPPADPAARPEELPHIQAPDDAPEQQPSGPAAFQSSRNLRAASEAAPAGPDAPPLPAIDGDDKPVFDLRNRDFRDGAVERTAAAAAAPPAPAAPAPSPAVESPPDPPRREPVSAQAGNAPPQDGSRPDPSEESRPQDAEPVFQDDLSPSIVSLPQPELIRPAEVPRRRAPPPRAAEAEDDASAYRPQTRKALSRGKITNRGAEASVDAVATPEGRYGKTIYDIIGRNWHRKVHSLGGLVSAGLVEVDFEIDLSGRISNVRLANPGEANPVMQDCALSAVLNAKLPPPPKELVAAMRDRITGGRIPQRISFLSY